MAAPIEYADAAPEVRAVYDDIKQTRQIKDVNNFWKYLAHDPATLKRTWLSLKEIMAPNTVTPTKKAPSGPLTWPLAWDTSQGAQAAGRAVEGQRRPDPCGPGSGRGAPSLCSAAEERHRACTDNRICGRGCA